MSDGLAGMPGMALEPSLSDGVAAALAATSGSPGGMTGRQKAAALLVTLGPERAAKIFSCLDDTEIEALSLEMTQTGFMDPKATDQVLNEVAETALVASWAGAGGFDYAREVLEKAVGEERSAEIMRRLSAVIEKRPFDFLRRSTPDQISNFLAGEAPQTVALVIANLDPALGADVIRSLEPEQQAEVAIRIATMGDTNPDVTREIEAVMRQKLASVLSSEFQVAGGVEAIVEILARSDRATERNVIDRLAERNHELAEEIRLKLFVFEDIVKLDDRSMQILLKDVDQKDLVSALRGVADDVKDKVMSNLSQRAAEMLLDELSVAPPTKRRVVEEAQGRIVVTVRKLEEAEAITIGRPEDDDEEMIA
ncbi:MAG: flagellar motor switch protein FliG [Thermoleophilaceae bacterium]|jgi:flagellar motor switch protein FliG|nr:flagellar motor switch protein FliG [Thermoleophilaceae bacterium]